MMKRYQYPLLIVALIVVLLAVSGCSGTPPTGGAINASGPTQSQPADTKPNGKPAGETMRIVVYYATPDASYVTPDVYNVPHNDQPARTALELLVAGTKNPQLVSVVPEGTKVKHFWIKDHIAYVDFNDKITKNNSGGADSELLLVASIVNTLTEFPNISKVQFLVEGKHVESISGHMDVSEPLSRSEKIIKKAL